MVAARLTIKDGSTETVIDASVSGTQFQIAHPGGTPILKKITFQTSDNKRFDYYFSPTQTLIPGDQTLSIAPPQVLSYWAGGLIMEINEAEPRTGTAAYTISGKVVAPERSSGTRTWYPNTSKDVPDAMSTTDGRANQAAIITAFGGIGANGNTFAARWTYWLRAGGYSDWHLPVASEYMIFSALFNAEKEAFNDLWASYGGEKFIYGVATGNTRNFWTSENISASQARMAVLEGGSAGTVAPGTKNFGCHVLVFRKFKFVDTGVVIKTSINTGEWFTPETWTPSGVPSLSDNVVVNHLVTIANTASVNRLTINTAQSLTIEAGQSLTVADALTNNGTMILQSNEINGTATLISNRILSGGSFTLHQAADARTYYMSVPISGAMTTTGFDFGGTFDIATDAWTKLTSAPVSYTVGQGYLMARADVDTEFTFTDSALLTTSVTPTINYLGRYFNFVGNPFTAYIDWSKLTKTNLEDAVWFRTKNAANTAYVFDTYINSVGTSNSGTTVTGSIAPLQGFWVRAKDETSALTIPLSARSHKTELTNRFLVPASSSVSEPGLLRLAVSNGTNSDEAIIYFKDNTLNGYDKYDAEKMPNNSQSIPEIYTLLDGRQIVINGMQTIPYDTEIPLGFKTDVAGNFTLSASEFSNFGSSEKVILKDKLLDTQIDLTTGIYSFDSGVDNTTSRFAVVFPRAETPTGIDGLDEAHFYAYMKERHLVVATDGFVPGTLIQIFNNLGHRVVSQAVVGEVTTIRNVLPTGIYVVMVNRSTTKLIVK